MKNEIRLYYVFAVIALIGTWTFNIRFGLEGKGVLDFFHDGFHGNAARSMAWDIFLLGLTLFPWMIREGRRYGVPHLWIYIAGSLGIAISFMFPLFLAARHKAMNGKTEIRKADGVTAIYPLAAAVSFVIVNLYVFYFLKEARPPQDFFVDWFVTNASSSLAIDLILITVTLLVFAAFEARRGKLKRLSPYIFMGVFGIAFATPWLFRELDVPRK